MFKKILYHYDKKHFGDQTLVYKGYYDQDVIYFVAITDRGEPSHYFVDSNLEKMYPVNSYIDRLGINIDFNNIPDYLDFTIDIDLSRYGCSECCYSLAKLIRDVYYIDFAVANKQFRRLHGKSYRIVDIIVESYLPILSNITVCFIVKTEKEKHIFLNTSYEKCCHEYLNFLKENNYYSDCDYTFMVLSKEDVKNNYEGVYHYAMN